MSSHGARRWPAEWERHEATLITWPWSAEIWGEAHEAAQHAMAQAVTELSRGEDVVVHVPAPAWEYGVRDRLARLGADATRVRYIIAPSDDVWVRDHGPTFVEAGDRRVAIDWGFNAWGGKFPHERDAQLAATMGATFADTVERAPIVFEGGAIETDGRGTVLTTRSVALTDTRNPGATEADVEEALRQHLGATDIVWLDAGMSCDDTDGHIDTLARFIAPGRVLVHVCADPTHPDAATLEANRATLATRFDVTPLPAATLHDTDGQLLPASHANFYIGNEVVLVPTYGIDTDAPALTTLATAFPDHRVAPLDSRALITQGGAIHCATQQLPALPTP